MTTDFNKRARWAFARRLCRAVGLCLIITGQIYAKDHNATHLHSTIFPGFPGGNYDPEPAHVNGNSIYTLANGAAHSGKVLDEVYLTLTFKAGEPVSLSRVINVSYGADNIPGSKFHATVSGQMLYLWYGFEDRAQETKPTYDALWKLTATGASPLSKVETYISYHGDAAGEMPDLFSNTNLRVASVSSIQTETGAMSGEVLTPSDGKKLIVFVHGWNPDSRSNHYAADSKTNWLGYPSGSGWKNLASYLLSNSVVTTGGWRVVRYDWASDAATGPASLNAVTNANAARDAANAHGWHLAELMQQNAPTHVQFIAHSAGNWAARRAAAILKHRNPSIKIAITALDPFVNDGNGINLVPAFEMTTSWVDHCENYYVIDNWQASMADLTAWTSGDFAGFNNQKLEDLLPLGLAFLYEDWMRFHGGPIEWYALTASRINLSSRDLLLFGGDGIGFLNSLAVREASPNDSFSNPAVLDAQLSGPSPIWFNYRASKEASEPDHGGDSGGRSVWGLWTAPSAGAVAINTYGSDFYTSLAVYTGSTIGSLIPVGSDTSGGKGNGLAMVAFNAVAGQTYRIAVDGLLGQSGKVVLNTSFVAAGGPAPIDVTINTPVSGATISGVTAVSATAPGATAMEFYLDSELQYTSTTEPFIWNWNTAQVLNGVHAVNARAYSLGNLLGASSATSVTVSNSTPTPVVDDHGNSSTQASVVSLGTGVQGFVSSPSDVDWFKVEVTTPGVLAFSLTVPAGKDYDLELFGPDSAYAKGSYGDAGAAESITYNSTTIGTYYVRIYGYPVGNGSFSAEVGYSLVVNRYDGNSLYRLVGWGNNSFGAAQLPPVLGSLTQIAASDGHNVAIRQDGTVVAWGYNQEGCSIVPVDLHNVVKVAASRLHTLALTSEGIVVAWGRTSEGQCNVPADLGHVIDIACYEQLSMALREDGTVVAWGDGFYGQTQVPAGLTGVKAIAAGARHCLALKADGSIVAWGRNDYGAASIPEGLANVVAIAASEDRSVALKADGTIFAWGRNDSGQSTVPEGLTDVVAIAASGFSNIALKRDGTVVTWGSHYFYGNGPEWAIPADAVNIIGIAAGGEYFMGLRSDGRLVTWGSKRQAQRGLSASSSGIKSIFARDSSTYLLRENGELEGWGSGMGSSLEVPDNLPPLASVSPGPSYTLALGLDGKLWAWGSSPYALLPPEGNEPFASVTAVDNAGIGLKTDGTVIGWGNNYYGQISIPNGLSNVVEIAAGRSHALALKSDGTVVGWGVVGYGNYEHYPNSVPEGLSGVLAISTTWDHSLALKADGTVVAWGLNNSGQASVPAGLAQVRAVATGWGHSLALKSDGTVVAWGDNTEGACDVPSNLTGVVAIAAGNGYSLALQRIDAPVVSNLTISAQPHGVNLSVAQSASFSVTVIGTAPITYQWQKNGRDIVGANAASYSTGPVALSNHGDRYRVRVRNLFQEVVSEAVSLTLYPPSEAPTINSQPQNLAVATGQPATFALVASGTPALAYNWQRQAAGAGGFVNLADEGAYTGATTATLRVDPVTGAMNGDKLRCVVSNGVVPNAISNTVTLSVISNVNYSSWRSDQFSAGEIADANISGPNADSDGDGLTNLIEYALGLDPRSQDASHGPVIQATSGEWTFTYRRPVDRSDLFYSVEASTNLREWASVGLSHERVSTDGETEIWQASKPISGAPNAFFRLRVSIAP